MAYDDPIDKNQGAVKISEVFTDRALDIIKTDIGESGIKVMEQLVRIAGDALRRINYIMFSPGRINWTGDEIEFDSDSRDNNIIFRILQTEDGNPATPRTVDLVLKGTDAGVNAESIFKSIQMVDGDILYLELDRSLVLAAGASKDLHNAVGGASVFQGLTVKKTNIATGMPSLKAQEGSLTDTFAIPLAMRVDWTDGVDSYQDIWWIPHGIRWPMNTRSALGGVVVLGLETWPSVFVGDQAQLIQALTDLSTSGGIILLNKPISLDSPITVPEGVSIISRSNKYGTAEAGLTLTTGAKITLGEGSKLFNLNIEGAASFGGTSNVVEQMIVMAGNKGEIRDCNFRLINVNVGTSEGSCIGVSGTNNRVFNCSFRLGATVTHRIGIKYLGGTNNTDTDSQFLVT